MSEEERCKFELGHSNREVLNNGGRPTAKFGRVSMVDPADEVVAVDVGYVLLGVTLQIQIIRMLYNLIQT